MSIDADRVDRLFRALASALRLIASFRIAEETEGACLSSDMLRADS